MPARRETDEMQLIRISEEEEEETKKSCSLDKTSVSSYLLLTRLAVKRVDGRSAGGAGRAVGGARQKPQLINETT